MPSGFTIGSNLSYRDIEDLVPSENSIVLNLLTIFATGQRIGGMSILSLAIALLLSLTKSRHQLLLENLALRQQVTTWRIWR
jgi:hypothetical protein